MYIEKQKRTNHSSFYFRQISHDKTKIKSYNKNSK